eukprot:scaffold41329_cov21-Tisochrysis_lutea.AAC.2
MIIQGALRCQKEGGRGGCALKVRNGCTMDVLMNIQGGARRDAGWDSSPAHVVKALKPEPSKTGVSALGQSQQFFSNFCQWTAVVLHHGRALSRQE